MIINYLTTSPMSVSKGSQQGSGLRRIVCLAALLVCFFANVQAQVKIGDISLTSGSFSSVSVGFEGIITSGYVNYNESGNVLRLYEASIKAGLDINKEGLTIQLIGDCSIQTTANGVYLRSNISVTTPEGAGSLTITSSGGTGLYIGQYTLTVSGIAVVSAEGKEYGIRGGLSSCGKLAMSDKATLKAKGSTMGSVRYMDLSDGPQTYGFPITSPAGAKYVDSRNGVVGTDDNMVYGEWVVFEKALAINDTNFPDGAFRYYVSETCDADGNGYLTNEEIAGVTEIDVSGRSIVSLQGIEFFRALKVLHCEHCRLTKELNVSYNTALEELYCISNQLNSINTYYCPALRIMECDYNYIKGSAIDVTQNTLLTKLTCTNNQLTSLDVSKNTALKELSCHHNQLNSLDASGCTALFELNCQFNQLTSVIVSNAGALRYLTCFKNMIRGENMTALVNSLPTVSNLQNYEGLWVFSEDESSGNMMTVEQVQVAKDKGWKVWMYDNAIGSLVEYPSSDFIVIDATKFPDANFRKWLREETDYGADGYLSPAEIAGVTEINVSNQNISDLKGIEFFNGLKELDCSYNQLTSLKVSHNYALTRLYCYCNRIRGTDMTKLVNSLPDRKSASEEGTLWVYYIDDSPAGNMMTPGQVEIAREKNWNVVMWDDDNEEFMPYEGVIPIDEENFPDDWFRQEVVGFDTNEDQYLSTVEIAEVTEIRYGGLIESLKGIEFFTELETLDIGNCPITELDLSKNTKLKYLQCYNCQLTGTLDLSKNTMLESLDCWNNQLEEINVSQCGELGWIRCYNNRLTGLDLSRNPKMYNLECYGNQIQGKDFKLPAFNASEFADAGTLYFYNDNGPSDGNMMTKLQVFLIKNSGWMVFYKDVGDYLGVGGDANVDDVIDEKDVEPMRNYILGRNVEPFSRLNADANGDGTVDIVDLTQLIEWLKEK